MGHTVWDTFIICKTHQNQQLLKQFPWQCNLVETLSDLSGELCVSIIIVTFPLFSWTWLQCTFNTVFGFKKCSLNNGETTTTTGICKFLLTENRSQMKKSYHLVKSVLNKQALLLFFSPLQWDVLLSISDAQSHTSILWAKSEHVGNPTKFLQRFLWTSQTTVLREHFHYR